ncbi:MAG: glycosyltransferase family 39 protein [Lachnospiraceae bacterium]|nr:glycosyltransferase family 39 protein [Lachnospiraceae bacterium]
MKEQIAKDKIITKFTDFSRAVLYIIAVGMLLWLGCKGLVNGRQWYGNISVVGVILLRVMILAGMITVSLLAGLAMEKLVQYRKHAERVILAVCCLLFWGVCIWWVSIVPYQMDGDQLIVWYNSVLALEGDFTMYGHGGQMFIYPQQQGLSFLYELLFRITGSTSYRMIGYVNASMAPLTLFFGYQCTKECFGEKAGMRFLPFMMLCLPYIIYSPYVYGDIPSICYGFILLWAVLKAINKGQYRYYVLACIVAVLALMSRMNMWIFFIGVVIGLVYLALHRWSFKPVLLGVCMVLSASLGMTGLKQFNSYRSGEPVSEGMPAILWVAMGLQYSEWGAGYYNHYSKGVYEKAGFDSDAAAAVGMQEVKDRLKIFLSDPAQTKMFFEAKMEMQWLDPLFESIEFTGRFNEEVEKPGEFVTWIYQGEGYSILCGFCSHVMAAVYIFAMLGVISRLSEKSPVWQDIPLIIFVGGFLFSIVWEAKARYMLPYFVLLLPYAANGLAAGTQMIGQIRIMEIIKTKFRKYK